MMSHALPDWLPQPSAPGSCHPQYHLTPLCKTPPMSRYRASPVPPVQHVQLLLLSSCAASSAGGFLTCIRIKYVALCANEAVAAKVPQCALTFLQRPCSLMTSEPSLGPGPDLVYLLVPCSLRIPKPPQFSLSTWTTCLSTVTGDTVTTEELCPPLSLACRHGCKPTSDTDASA